MCCPECDPQDESNAVPSVWTAIPLAELLADPRVAGLMRAESAFTFFVYVAMLGANRTEENAGKALPAETFMAAVGALLPGATPTDFVESCAAIEKHRLVLRWQATGRELLFTPSLAELERLQRERQGSDAEPGDPDEPARRAGYVQ
jgi:hypothetical protein